MYEEKKKERNSFTIYNWYHTEKFHYLDHLEFWKAFFAIKLVPSSFYDDDDLH